MEHEAGDGGWAAPGAAADDEGPRHAATMAPPYRRLRSPAAGPDDIPRMRLRPMTVAGLLDGAIAIVKARPRRILGFAAVFVVPASVVGAYAQRHADTVNLSGVFSSDPTVSDELSEPPTTAELTGASLQQIVSAIAIVCLAAAITHLVSHWSQGRDASGSDMFAAVGRHWWPLLASSVVWWPLLASSVLADVAPGLGFLGMVASLFAVVPFVVVAPVVSAEGTSASRALRRSSRLTRGRYWRTLGLILLIGFVGSVLGSLLASLLQTLALVVGLESGWPLLAAAGIASELLVVPFVAAAIVLLYLDLRVRAEGLDLEMTAQRVLDRAA